MPVRIFDREKSSSGLAFKDVSVTYWARTVIEQAAAMGLMQGYSDGTFKPDRRITRAEMASIAARLLNEKGTFETQTVCGKADFVDVSGDYWGRTAIEYVQTAGIISGYPDGTFRPEQTLTRAEAVVIIDRLLGRGPLSGAEQRWRNVPPSHWVYGYIQEASIDHHFVRLPDEERFASRF